VFDGEPEAGKQDSAKPLRSWCAVPSTPGKGLPKEAIRTSRTTPRKEQQEGFLEVFERRIQGR